MELSLRHKWVRFERKSQTSARYYTQHELSCKNSKRPSERQLPPAIFSALTTTATLGLTWTKAVAAHYTADKAILIKATVPKFSARSVFSSNDLDPPMLLLAIPANVSTVQLCATTLPTLRCACHPYCLSRSQHPLRQL